VLEEGSEIAFRELGCGLNLAPARQNYSRRSTGYASGESARGFVFSNAQETHLRKQRKGGPPARLSTRPVPVSLLNKREQIGIDLVCMRGRHPVRQSRVRLQRVVFQKLDRPWSEFRTRWQVREKSTRRGVL
jgi:hypothetical protein